MIQVTHDDLDGAACAVVADRLFGDVDREVLFCQYGSGYNSVDAAVTKLLEADVADEKPFLLLTDICPSEPVCEKLNASLNQFQKVLLVDHHESNKWALKYDWTKLDVDNMMCGAKLLLDGSIVPDEALLNFVSAVDAYDRWQLKSEHRGRGEVLNMLHNFLGPQLFVREFSKDPMADENTWLSNVVYVLRGEQRRAVSEAIESQLPAGLHTDSAGRKYAFLVVSEYVSEIGNAVLTQFSDIEYAVMALPGVDRVSLRSRKAFNVAEIASKHGGGGHSAAAGFPLPLREVVWNAIGGLL